MTQDLSTSQNDYAVFLPAISSFFSTYIGRQQEETYVEPSRMPAGIPNMEQLNFFNPNQGLFHYQWGLYSAGHADLDLSKHNSKENMLRKRASHTTLLADSGGFQIAKGVWEGEWNNPVDKKAEKKRSTVLEWLCNISDYSMTLDIPTWTFRDAKAAQASGIYSYEDAVNATKYNNEYFIKNRSGGAKFLNVLQGGNHTEAEHWYSQMKHYCDPSKYENHFNGWAMGGQNMCDVHLILKRLVTLIHDGLLEKGVHDWMHFLGTSKLEWAVLLTDIQRAIRNNHNSSFTISFDCASPFLATANGQIYTHTVAENRSKWSYRMEATADNKKYSSDTRSFRDAVIQDKIHGRFDDSPISKNLQIKDICVYAPGDLNKIGKEGKTSWDSFSYALMMSHNVWQHINAVQYANRQYDSGIIPSMLVKETFDRVYFKDVVNKIFETKSYKKQLEIIDHHSFLWENIIGTRGFTGKRAINAHAQFNALFDLGDGDADTEDNFDENCLIKLEESV